MPGPAGLGAVFLGLDRERPVFARPAADGGGELATLTELRGAALTMDAADAGLFAYAAALLHWNRTHRFCGICGEPTAVAEPGTAGVVSTATALTAHGPRRDHARGRPAG